MAKKKTKGSFTFKDITGLTDGILKKNKTSIKRETEKTASNRTFVGTGIYALNAAISSDIYGGIPDNRITVLAGESGVGKSFLCYNICREAQKDGYSIIYIDTEFAIELDQLPGYGLDTSEDKFMLIRNNVIEDLKIFLTQMLDNLREQKNNGVEIDKFLIVLDSVGQLGSRKEVEDAKSGKEKADFTKAKALASLFRITSSDLGDLSIPLIATNHTYKTLDLYPQDKMKGGCVEPFHIIQTDDGLKEIQDIEKGDYVKTLTGFEEVLETHKYEKEMIDFEFENGISFKVSKNHRFLINEDHTKEESWKLATDLNADDEIFMM